MDKTIWNTVAASAVVILAVFSWWVARNALLERENEFKLLAYVNCVNRYMAAKESGRFPTGYEMPSASEVCEKYKR